MDLSIVIPALNERDNLVQLIPLLHREVPPEVTTYEIIIVDGGSVDGTADVAEKLGVRVCKQSRPGYGGALAAGFAQARGEYILTMDADLSHSPRFISTLWQARTRAELVIASRYVPGGAAEMPLLRLILSRILNVIFGRGMSLPIRDVSSGFRLYRSAALQGVHLESTHFDVLEEILIRLYAEGWQIIEVPFQYEARANGSSHATLVKFGWAYLKTLWRMWRFRNSIESADYDYRAYDSVIPLQRYWQRTRYKVVTAFARGAGRTLDIGCGSSRILIGLEDAIGLDIKMSKVRYISHHHARGAVGSAFALPFADESFDCIICSQVLEHLPAAPVLFQEFSRLLRPGGRLIVGTPNYGNPLWPTIEFFYSLLLPRAYANEHITHYTRRSLQEVLQQYGFECQAVGWVGLAEMVLQCTKEGGERCPVLAGGTVVGAQVSLSSPGNLGSHRSAAGRTSIEATGVPPQLKRT